MQVSASPGNAYRGPGAPANGPKHHYTIEVFALDTKLGKLLAPAERVMGFAMLSSQVVSRLSGRVLQGGGLRGFFGGGGVQ